MAPLVVEQLASPFLHQVASRSGIVIGVAAGSDPVTEQSNAVTGARHPVSVCPRARIRATYCRSFRYPNWQAKTMHRLTRRRRVSFGAQGRSVDRVVLHLAPVHFGIILGTAKLLTRSLIQSVLTEKMARLSMVTLEMSSTNDEWRQDVHEDAVSQFLRTIGDSKGTSGQKGRIHVVRTRVTRVVWAGSTSRACVKLGSRHCGRPSDATEGDVCTGYQKSVIIA